jgi:CDP-diglyceride synthetase
MTLKTSQQLKDLAVCVAAGTAIVAAALWYGVYEAGRGQPPAITVKWLALAGNTLLVFWYGIRPFRHHWRERRVKLTTTALLIAHLAVFVVVLTHVSRWQLFWYVPTDFLEVALIFVVLSWLADRMPPSRRHGTGCQGAAQTFPNESGGNVAPRQQWEDRSEH